MNLIQEGKKNKLIKFSDDEKQISYPLNFHRSQNFNDPGEKEYTDFCIEPSSTK